MAKNRIKTFLVGYQNGVLIVFSSFAEHYNKLAIINKEIQLK